MKVELIDHMGSDLSVVNAARVSFDKASEWEEIHNLTREKPLLVLSHKDTKLISYLAEHNHWSPFAHAFASFRIKAPIFVARQLVKHQVGLAWNEVSRRYVDSEPEFYTPDVWRKRADNVKQGSSDEAVERLNFIGRFDDSDRVSDHAKRVNDHALEVYNRMLDSGVCPEQARMVLPQSMMTEWIWSGSLYAFARVCHLRLDSHTQKETQVIAQGIAKELEQLFPVSWKALLKNDHS